MGRCPPPLPLISRFFVLKACQSAQGAECLGSNTRNVVPEERDECGNACAFPHGSQCFCALSSNKGVCALGKLFDPLSQIDEAEEASAVDTGSETVPSEGLFLRDHQVLLQNFPASGGLHGSECRAYGEQNRKLEFGIGRLGPFLQSASFGGGMETSKGDPCRCRP